MGINLRITFVAILVLAIAGCSAKEEPQTIEPAPTQTKASTTKPFENPVVPAKDNNVASKTTLIQPTNATERVGVVNKGRTDPFAEIVEPIAIPNSSVSDRTYTNTTKPVPNSLPVPVARRPGSSSRTYTNTTKPVPNLPPVPVARRPGISSVAQIPKSIRRSGVISARTPNSSQTSKTTRSTQSTKKTTATSQAKPQQRAATQTQPLSKPGFTPVTPKVLPPVVPNPDLASVLPPPPEPELAKAVLVSGVIVVGDQPHAIIKVPSEPTSRYVKSGQLLANGVLIKRIEMNEGSEPVVIMEQYGIEVARTVGETTGDATATGNQNPVSVSSPQLTPVSVGAS